MYNVEYQDYTHKCPDLNSRDYHLRSTSVPHSHGHTAGVCMTGDIQCLWSSLFSKPSAPSWPQFLPDLVDTWATLIKHSCTLSLSYHAHSLSSPGLHLRSWLFLLQKWHIHANGCHHILLASNPHRALNSKTIRPLTFATLPLFCVAREHQDLRGWLQRQKQKRPGSLIHYLFHLWQVTSL